MIKLITENAGKIPFLVLTLLIIVCVGWKCNRTIEIPPDNSLEMSALAKSIDGWDCYIVSPNACYVTKGKRDPKDCWAAAVVKKPGIVYCQRVKEGIVGWQLTGDDEMVAKMVKLLLKGK